MPSQKGRRGWCVLEQSVCVSLRSLRRRPSPRLCGWLREVNLRATSPAAAAQMGARRRRKRAALLEAEWKRRRDLEEKENEKEEAEWERRFVEQWVKIFVLSRASARARPRRPLD